MKQNDWIIATLNNPTFDIQDFKYISEMSLNNTQLLPKETYLKSNYILENERFKNQDGQFSQDLFDTFYREAANRFAQFSTEDIVDNYQYEYDIFDARRPVGGKIKDPNFRLGTYNNPDHITVGVSGFNEVSNSDKSRRESAQNSKIFDPQSGTFLDVSVNDLSLFSNPVEYFKSLFSDPLVYAIYEQDEIEIDPVTKKQIKHVKGEWKVNNQGEYYTERLNGRSLIGKQVVSFLDYLTSENSGIHKYDFFDADGLDKSIGGTLTKNIVAVLPMFNPYLRVGYSGLLVARELSKSLPMLYGILTGLSGQEETESTLANVLASYGQKFTGSTSDYAQQNTFSFENFGNLMSDVALQWGQQKIIANTFAKLNGGGQKAIQTAHAKALGEYQERVTKAIDDLYAGKLSPEKLAQYTGISSFNPKTLNALITSGNWEKTAFGKAALNKYMPAAQKILESRMRTGQDLSLVYMAIVSNTDVYQSILEKGGTPFEAAAIALGSTVGMFSVDKYLGLGEMFFNDEPARRAIRESARHNAELLMSQVGIQQTTASTKKGIIGLIQKGMKIGKKAVEDYRGNIKDRSLGFFGKSLGEGLEEVSEELVTDISKYLGELAGRMGYFSQTDYGAWENLLDRYGMSFLGGAAGGGMFYGVELVQNRNQQSRELQNDIMYLLRQGKKQEIISELNKLKSKGKLGSTELSYKTTTDDNGNLVYLTADEDSPSQSDYIYNTLIKTIDQLDLILNQNDLALDENDLFDKMVQGEYRAVTLSDFLKGDRENVKEISYITRYQEDFQNLLNRIVNKEAEIQNLIGSTSDPNKREADFDDKLNKLKQEKEELLKERDYLFGEGSLGYVQKMLFAMDTQLSGNFTSLNFNQFVRALTGKSIEELTSAEKDTYKTLWQSQDKKQNLDTAFKVFLEMQKNLSPELIQLQGMDFSQLLQQFQEIHDLDPFSKYLNYDSKLDEESDEDYSYRNKKKEGESDEQFTIRRRDREAKIKKYNEDHLMEWINNFSDSPVDRSSFRRLQARLGVLKKTVEEQLIESLQIPNNVELQHELWNILKTTGVAQDKRDELKRQVREAINKAVKNNVENQYKDQLNADQWEIVKQHLQGLSQLDEDTKVDLGIDYDYNYDENSPLTLKDLYTFIESKINLENNKRQLQNNEDLSQEEIERLSKDYTINDLIEELQAHDLFPWVFDESQLGKTNNGIIDFYTRVKSGMASLESDEGNTAVEVNDDFIDQAIATSSQESFDNIINTIENQVIKNIESNEDLRALTNLENSTFVNNPIMPILQKISKKLRGSEINIESFLEDIYQQFKEGPSGRDFWLTDQQLKQLKAFKQDLQMAKAFFYAASSQTSYETPIGHNKQVNQYVENHKNVFGNTDLLPEIESDTANFLINESDSYIKEIDQWIQRSQANTADKIKKFIEADLALNTTKLEFIKVNREAFEINPTLDLLEGYEDLVLDNSLTSVVKVGDLLHRNYKKAVQSGVQIEDILDAMLPKIVNLESLKSQLTSQLDETLQYSKLTDYDKVVMLISTFAISESDFYRKLRDFINNNPGIAPLSIQEYASKIIQAQQQDPELINKVLRYLRTKLDLENIPILENTAVVTGVGGSGKTQAVAKLSVEDDIWYSGPTQSQIDNLAEVLPKGKGISKQELFELILGKEEATEFLSSVQWNQEKGKWEDNTKGKYYTKTRDIVGDTTVKLKDSVKVNKIPNTPKQLIIDEATHFSTAELQVISKFTKENGIQVVLLGDPNQNGYNKIGLMQNLNRESIIAWRTPKLFISLRDNNVQKIHNLQSVIDIIDKLSNTSTEAQLEETTKNILDQDLPKLVFKYYNGSEFFGERITDSISDDIIQKLDGDIGFIGNETSPIYWQLKNAGKNVILIDPISVQGREFTYTVVDKQWDIDTDYSNIKKTGVQLYSFMKDLYTMISRSRKGTILIDNGLSKIVRNLQDEFTGESSSIKQAINEFRQKRLSQIDEALSQAAELFKENQHTQQEELDNPPPPSTEEGSDDAGETDIILGTNVKVDQLEEEKSPVVEHDKERQEEIEIAQQEEQESTFQLDTPVRVYSNVSYSGIDTHKDVWTNDEDSRSDLGIFLRKGESISKGEDKYKLVEKLIQLKAVFNYGFTYYDRLPKSIRNLIPKDALEQVEYYISVEDENPSNTLVGLTNLDSSKRTINGKVITLKAKIKVSKDVTRDQDVEYTLTLGGLANPETWGRKESNIRKSIQKRIDNGDPDSASLQDYLNNLSQYILQYRNKIEEISRTNQEFRINTPKFSGMTTLIRTDDLRLEDINSKFSPYDENSAYSVKSRIYKIVDDIPGIDPSLKGKPVMYVSSNILLNPDELESMYIAQKNDSSLVPQVRMVVLDTVGVSFKSLYQKKYKDIYEISQGGVLYTNPFYAEPMAIRMYISMWNFRSNLKKFLQIYEEWLNKGSLSQDYIEQLCELDRKEYLKIRGDNKYLDEQQYRAQVSDEVRNKVKVIWDFNDSLAELVREFRLGYSKSNGAYIRKLTNLTEGELYEDTQNVLGIYINPSMARQYDKMLDALFDNIINKIIPSDQNPMQYITTKLANQKGWFKEIDRTRQISIKMIDDSGKELGVSLNVPRENSLSSLPSILIETAKYLSIRGLNPESFDEYLVQSEDPRYSIKFGDDLLNWKSLAEELDGGQIETDEDIMFEQDQFPPGIQPLITERSSTGEILSRRGIIDKRIDNLFSLMFHGVISTSRENDFTRDDIRATDASFKYGFFADPILVKNDGKEKANAPVVTNRKLFRANVVPGLPLITVSLQKYEEKQKEEVDQPKEEPKTYDNNLEQVKTSSLDILSNSGISISERALSKVQTLQELFDLVNQKIQNKFEQYFNGQELTSLNTLLTEVRIDDNKLVFSYFTQSDWLEGHNIEKQEWKSKAMIITLDNGKQYSLQILMGNLQYREISEPNAEGRTVGEVISQIHEVIEVLKDSMNDSELQDTERVIQEAFRGNTEDTIASENLIQRAIDQVQKKLGDFEEESDPEWTSTLNEVINKLTKLKNINCIL